MVPALLQRKMPNRAKHEKEEKDGSGMMELPITL
jgi:hypothetical protein